MISDVEHLSFHVSVGRQHVFFGKMSLWVLCPLFNQILFLLLSCKSFLYTLDINPLSDI